MIFLLCNLVVYVLYEQDKIDGLPRWGRRLCRLKKVDAHRRWVEERAHLVLSDAGGFSGLQVLLLPLNVLILGLSGAGLIMVIFLPLLVAGFYHKRLWDRQEEKKRRILGDYQRMIQYATLHLLAGDSLENALKRAVKQMESFDPLEKKELSLAGRGVLAALKKESARLKLAETRRLTHYLQVSFEKGEAQTYQALYKIGEDFFKMRMKHARKKAQEMSQALLLPILLIFLSILMILVMPSLLTLLG